MKILLYTILISTFIGCHTKNSIPKEIEAYLNETIDLLENKSVNKNKIDWNEFRVDVFKKAKNAKKTEDTYAALSYAVSELNDNHSYFKPATEAGITAENKPLPKLSDEFTPNDIGYIRIPFCIGKENDYDDYITTISAKIKEQLKKKTKGWIIDLRGNFGGNMWPMLLSLEPLIGNGTFGYFVDADNQYQAWKLNKGKVFIDDELIFQNKLYEKLDLSDQYLAILTDGKTASSGEAIAVALKYRMKSKSFGKPTYGVSTGCVSHQLSDGSTLNLAESVFADKKMNKYGLSINPDVIIDENEALKSGIKWIYKMNKTTANIRG